MQYGAKVAVTGRSESKIQSASQWLGGDGLAIQSDAADPVQVDRAFSEVRAHFGDLHGLYHVAGGSGRRFGDGPMHEITDEGWLPTAIVRRCVFFWSRGRAEVFSIVVQFWGFLRHLIFSQHMPMPLPRRPWLAWSSRVPPIMPKKGFA